MDRRKSAPESLRIRPATSADHADFVRLFPELGTDDAIFDGERFAREMVPTTLIAEREGRAVGYAYYRLLEGTAHVVQLVTSPEARGAGVGRTLLGAIAERAEAAGCSTWYLNVRPDNAPALALYRRMGFAPAFTSRAMRVAWSIVDAAGAEPRGEPRGAWGPGDTAAARVTARAIDPDEDVAVEAAVGMVKGQLALARRMGGRVLMALEEDGAVVGAAVFDPAFPGAYPFRVARPGHALLLLRALRPHARPEDATLSVVVEDRHDVADALIAAGASLRLEILRMNGALPPPA